MTRNLKVLGLALLAVGALGAVGAQGALAQESQEFHAEEAEIVITGENLIAETFQVGAAGTVSCAKSEYEATQQGVQINLEPTYKTDTLTAIPRYKECTFGGQPATVNFNHCGYIFDSDTTKGNEHPKPEEKEHANVTLECSSETKVEIHTSVCTITIGPQQLAHAVRYTNNTPSSIILNATVKNVIVGKARTTASQPASGCLLFPTGAIGTYTGESTAKCFEDEGETIGGLTEKTTPTTEHGATRKCTVALT